MCCCSCAAASSPLTGSRPVHRRSWWTSCSNASVSSVSLDEMLGTAITVIGVRRRRPHRRRAHRHRGAVVPDRLPDYHRGRASSGGKALYPARLSQPGGAAEPERASAAPPGPGLGPADRQQHPPRRACWRRTTAPASKHCSTPSSPVFPSRWYADRRCRRTNNDIANYEGFYGSVFYSYFAALGYDIAVEESSSHGRLDMAVRTAGHVYLFEFKVAEMAPPGSALVAVAGAPLRRQVPRQRRADPPHRRRVQPRHPQPHRLRDSRRLRSGNDRPALRTPCR